MRSVLINGTHLWYAIHCSMREKRENRLRRARQNCRGGLVLLGGAALFRGRRWSGEGGSLGGRWGFYGCERVSLGKSHMWFSKKSHVVLRISTCGFLQSHMWFYPRQAQNVPKKGWERTQGRLGCDRFEGWEGQRPRRILGKGVESWAEIWYNIGSIG